MNNKITLDIALQLFGIDIVTYYTNFDIVRKIYKKKMIKYHPDKDIRNIYACKNTQILNEAYKVLLENKQEDISSKILSFLEDNINGEDSDEIKKYGYSLYIFTSELISVYNKNKK